MKKSLFLIFCLVLIQFSCSKSEQKEAEIDSHEHHHEGHEQEPADSKKSVPMEEHAMVWGAHITLKYHSPAVRGRVIWGGLVPYEEVWVSGAHQATSFEIDKSFTIGNMEIPAGKYAIFTIPDVSEWTFILNKNWNQHLADEYDPAEDVVRVKITPSKKSEVTERLSYTIEELESSQAAIIFGWERLKLEIPFIINP